MISLKGVSEASRKDGTIYYRSSITYKSKHISLGSYPSALFAHNAYKEAKDILNSNQTIFEYRNNSLLSFEKHVILINFRDNKYYIKNPIYLHKYYLSYYLDIKTELIFDVDDLFYYSNHKIFTKNGYMFVNDYGMQVNILSRYGIKNFAVNEKDYIFKDGNCNNMRYHNIIIINKYYGVERISRNNIHLYLAKIRINGYMRIGIYKTEIEAAISYNKAVDFVKNNNISEINYNKNFISELDSYEDYMKIYDTIKLSKNLLSLQS